MRKYITFLSVLFGLSTVASSTLAKNSAGKNFENNTNVDRSSKVIEMAQRVIPRNILFEKPDKMAVRLNNEGDKISYISRRDKNVALVVTDLSDNITHEFPIQSARNMGEYVWSLNDDFIFVLQDTNGDENNHIIALNLKDKSKKDLTPFDGVRAEFVCANAKDNNELIVKINKRNPQWMDTYRLNIITGEMTLLFENNKYGEVLFDEDLRPRIATSASNDGGTDVWLFENNEPKLMRHVSHEDSSNSQFIIQSKIIGDDWYYLSSEGQDKNALIKYNLKTKITEKIFTTDECDIQGVSFDKDTQTPLMVSTEYLKPTLQSIDKNFEKHLSSIKSKFADYIIDITSWDKSKSKWIVVVSKTTESPKYYLYNTIDNSLKFLFNAQQLLQGYAFQEMQAVVIKSRDGLDLVCYLTKASSKSDKLVVYVHGGPWARDSYGFNKVAQFLSNRGYSVLQVNYRGSTGFGKRFSSAINMNLDKVRNDIIDAAQWAIDNGIAHKDKVAIMGGSFGGYSVLAGLTFTPDFFACGVDVVGVSNWETVFSKVPEYWKPFMIGWYKCAGDPSTKEGLELLKKNSPITCVQNIKKPLIVFQGEHDPRVNKYESELIVSEMKKRNIPVSYVLYPDEGHGFLKEANNLSYLALTEKFLSHHLGGWYEPIHNNDLKDSSHKIIENGDM